jgi:hypothetical protein
MELFLKMRKRPDRDDMEKKFINGAVADKKDDVYEQDKTEANSHENVTRKKWPLEDIVIEPLLAPGSSLRRPINLPLKEYEWNSLDRHTRSLGVQKTEWIRYAIFKLMGEEQNHFKNKKK